MPASLRCWSRGPPVWGRTKFAEFEKGIGWVWERAPGDHYRVDPDWDSSKSKSLRKPLPAWPLCWPGEAHLATIDRALVGQALDSGLEIAPSQVVAVNSMMVFGGLYYSTKEGADFDPYSAASYDPTVPWAAPGDAGKLVRSGHEQGHRPRLPSGKTSLTDRAPRAASPA